MNKDYQQALAVLDDLTPAELVALLEQITVRLQSYVGPLEEETVEEQEDITLYLLNTQHPKGRGKAKFFMQFGFSVAQWKQLADALFDHAQTYEVVKTEQTQFGTRYVIEGTLETPINRQPQVRVVWFISTDSTQPHLVTAYPLESSDD